MSEKTRAAGAHIVLGTDPAEIQAMQGVDGRPESSLLRLGDNVTVTTTHSTPATLRALAAAANHLADWQEQGEGVRAA